MFGWYLKSGVVLASCENSCFKSMKVAMSVDNKARNGKRTFQNEECEEEETKKQKFQQKGHWAKGLLSAMEDPNLKVQDDELVIVINDKFPKAECHYLVIPKENIASLKEVNEMHLSLLKHMHKVAKKLTKAQPDRTFKIGFHAHASMTQLHLHVISDDFNSPCLKTKKHWNSFTTEFLVPYEEVKSEIKKNGRYAEKPEAELSQLLLRDLQCHKCPFVSKTIPKLKDHVRKVHFSEIKNTRVIFNN